MGKLVPLLIRHFEIEWAEEEAEWRVETYRAGLRNNMG